MLEPYVKQRPPGEIEAQFLDMVERLNTATMEGIANAVVDASPVDTGTYVTSHAVYEGDDVGSIPAFYSSLGRAGGQDENQMKTMAKAKMTTFIQQLDFRQSSFMFGNESEHRGDVEKTWGYEVFRAGAEAFPGAVQAAKASVGVGQR